MTARIRNEVLPFFAIVGAPKCGTTTVATHLSEHPEVTFSVPKEPHFFSKDYPFGPNDIDTFSEYLRRCFSKKPLHKVYGDGSVWYLYSNTAVENIEKQFDGSAKYIVCLRNPVHASFSLHSQHVAFEWEPDRDFVACLARTDQVIEAMKLPDKIKKVLSYNRIYAYSRHISRLLNVVDRDRIFFVILEQDFRDPAELYSRIHEFLCVNHIAKDYTKKLNSARRISNRLVAELARSKFTLTLMRHARRRIAPNGFGLGRPMPAITPREFEFGWQIFETDARETARIVGFDVRVWADQRYSR